MAVKARPFDVRHEPEDRYDVRSERNTLNIIQIRVVPWNSSSI